MSDSLYIVIPAYNEQENILSVLEQWYSVLNLYGNNDSRLVVLNDGSKDSTYDLMCDFAKQHSRLVAINKENSGHGATIMKGYRYALDSNADFIFQTDSDGQTNPGEFEWFWMHRNEADMVIGVRANREDGFSRKIVAKVLKYVIRFRFGVTLPDANAPFRLMTKQSLQACILDIPDDYALSNVLLSVLYAKKGLRVLKHPISFKPRQGGRNSINLSNIFAIGKKSLQEFKKINEGIQK